MNVRVTITPKQGILDPQGATVSVLCRPSGSRA